MRTKTLLTSAGFAKQGEAFAPVSLPHTWNALDGQDGGNDYWRGVGIYQIDLPNPTAGKKQYIELRGANHVATVYCNGRELGTHKGGFSTFRYDLTPSMKAEGNVLTVVVTNGKSDIYPQNADFTFYGGLYRDVNFIEVENAHFDLLKDGTDAVFVTPRISGKTRLDIFPVNAEGCTVAVELKDAEGNVVGSDTAAAKAHTIFKLDVNEPHLWNGMADPYCYTASATLTKDGDVLDTVTVTYGYRGFHVDPETGFYLNGKNVPLRGVARHQDRLDKGWAIGKAEHEEDIALIKEVGANTIRLAHYQHDQYFYDLCDKTGFVLWAEISFISSFIPGKEAYENTLSQMTELIAQNYNHPSICFWGISNEITIGGEQEELYRNLNDVNALVKKMDPSRLTTMAEVSMVAMNSEPMVHVCGERFVDRGPNERSVIVYTNCPEVTLIVNGTEVATKAAKDHAVVFEDVALNDGANTVTAKSGDIQGNTITLNAVAQHNMAYDLPDGEEEAGNWFNDPNAKPLEYPEG